MNSAGKIVWRARRDIAAGEEVTHSYLSEETLFASVPVRQRSLQKSFAFTCTCSRCIGEDDCRGLHCRHCHEGTVFANARSNGVKARACQEERLVEGQSLLGDSENCVLTVGAPDMQRSSGKFYYEVKLGRNVVHPQIGWAAEEFEQEDVWNGCFVGDNEHSWAADGQSNGSYTGGNFDATVWPQIFSEDDVVGCAIDLDEGTLQFAENGRWVSSADARIPVGGSSIYPAVSLQGECTFNFLASSFEFSPPDQGFTPLLGSEDSSGVLSRWSSHHRAFVDSACGSCGSKVGVDESQEFSRSERALRKTVQGWDGRYPEVREAEVVEELLASMCTQHFLANDLYAELAEYYSIECEYELQILSLQKRCSFYKGVYEGLCAPHAWAIEALADARANQALDPIVPTDDFASADLLRCALCGYAQALGILTSMYGSSFTRAKVVQAKIVKANGFLEKYSGAVDQPHKGTGEGYPQGLQAA